MATSSTPQFTDFSRDILGRYMCNGLDEAMRSMDKNGQRPDGSPQSDARPFNAIIVGGGSFGGVLAQHLLFADDTNSYRILVLEAGQHSLPEHFQNLPLQGQPTEMFGLPWEAPNVAGGFPGLAYTVGGRSLFFGGWSPRLLDEEMPPPTWPSTVVNELKQRYFDQAASQIGTDSSNDFIHGPLHDALRQLLASGIKNNKVRHAIPLDQLPIHLKDVGANAPEELKLEAPLAVHAKPPLPGFFPINKFSSAPLLMEAARVAQTRSAGDDVKKRLMIVPSAHVTRLVTTPSNGTTVVTDGAAQAESIRAGAGGSRPGRWRRDHRLGHDREHALGADLVPESSEHGFDRPEPHGASALEPHHPHSAQRAAGGLARRARNVGAVREGEVQTCGQ